jgi:hypothetical protein
MCDIHVCTYMYICMHMYMYAYVYIYIYVRAERERDRDRASEGGTHQQHGDPPQNLGSPDRTPASACMWRRSERVTWAGSTRTHEREPCQVRCQFFSFTRGRESERGTHQCMYTSIYIYIYIYICICRERASERGTAVICRVLRVQRESERARHSGDL